MRLLLDTHAFLWFISDDGRLPARARRAILDSRNDRWLSVASIWEMAIKVSLGKLRLDVSLDELVASEAVGNGICILPLEPRHAMAVAALPFHHRDPFDRILVCQALAEELTLVSGDAELNAYEVRLLWSDPRKGSAAAKATPPDDREP